MFQQVEPCVQEALDFRRGLLEAWQANYNISILGEDGNRVSFGQIVAASEVPFVHVAAFVGQ